ncbi:DUF3052 family protein [Angustibacter peucedani]
MSSPTGYSGTPLATKLGIKAGSRVLLDGAPPRFDLGLLPDDVTLHFRAGRDPYDVVLAFAPDRRRLDTRWPALHARTTTAGRLWVAWPKRSSGVPTDLDDNSVREFGLAHGRVDVKVCAVDAAWSGLCFVVRLADR